MLGFKPGIRKSPDFLAEYIFGKRSRGFLLQFVTGAKCARIPLFTASSSNG
jgi:hypothetical protein